MKRRPFIRSNRFDASSSKVGASRTMESVMPVRFWMNAGIGFCGLTSELHCVESGRPGLDDADFGNPIDAERAARRFEIDKDDGVGGKFVAGERRKSVHLDK